MQYLEFEFHELHRNLKMVCKLYISCSTHILYITRMPISYSGCPWSISQVYIIIFIFVGLQRSIGQPKFDFYTFQKIVIKKMDHKKKSLDHGHLIIDHFYLLISLEGMASFIQQIVSKIVEFWDVHLHNE